MKWSFLIFLQGIISALLLAVVMPNMLLWGASEYFGVGRTALNIDYFFVLAALTLGCWRLSVFLLIFMMSIDFLSMVVQVFPFMRFEDLLYLSSFIWVAPVSYRVWLVCAVLIVFLGVFFLYRIRHKLVRESSLFVLLLGFFWFQVESVEDRSRFWRVADLNAISSQSAVFFNGRLSPFLSNFSGADSALGEYYGKAASDQWRSEWQEGLLGERLLLIVNESWGMANNSEVNDYLLSFLRSAPIVELKTGELYFKGATVAAELRELCRLHPNHFGFRDAYNRLKTCLPAQLDSAGYKTHAMHGATGMMYDRRDWYSGAGFSEDVFFEDMLPERRCYSFPGACDVDLRDRVEGFFRVKGKRFFYWLTLNTHSIYDERDLFVDLVPCSKFNIDPSSESCRNFKLQAQYFSALGELLRSPDMSGVDVLLVGDHEPRFRNQYEKGLYYATGKVPWVRFKVSDILPLAGKN
ncbi:MAG: hypothetical protein KKG30_18620 [Gammaproteobacteria bacterium]|nr:hypothetical protein [Gammaproteobacteria bacterium]MBU1489104.1 hypothetical protein [Gammaproteobacteria bacterium]MBU2066076.1 hypothetical protein [Gammaproteobacteria bacterium]MBU2139964.1 hypothetical protein [Gammaproteobacteria bacterium]MBU2218557.1 hypothetical protein [Gammaproteobacteria bacterium]